MSGKPVGYSAWPRSSPSAYCCCSLPICTRVFVPRLRTGGKVTKLLSSLLLCALLLQADFQPSRWKYRRPLTVDPAAPIVVVNLDRGTYIHSQADLSDLRVVRGQDEVPYVREKMSGALTREDLSRDVIDQGVTSSRGLELT